MLKHFSLYKKGLICSIQEKEIYFLRSAAFEAFAELKTFLTHITNISYISNGF